MASSGQWVDGLARPELAALPDRVRLPLALSLAGVAEAVAALPPDWWIPHFVAQHFSGAWDVLPLRASAAARHPIQRIAAQPDASDWIDTPELAALPALGALLAAFACPSGAARLMRLAPGSTIHEHRDLGLAAAEGCARLHVPIASGPAVSFLLNGSPVPMAVGECWYLRLTDPHAVANRGDVPRIHLVIDALVDDWLAARLLEGAH